MRILCCGEALIDMLPRQMSDGQDGYVPVPGGAIFNTAIALGRLGQEVGFFSSLSKDIFGNQLKDALQKSNVDVSLVCHTAKPSTLAFVKLVQGQARYSFFDENSAGRNLNERMLPEVPGNVQALLFGAISLIPEPCGSAYETMMAQNTDKVLMLDPNIRSSFMTDEVAHRRRIERMSVYADIIKISDEDLEWIANGNDPADQLNDWIVAEKLVLITRGQTGATAFWKQIACEVAAPDIHCVDTIGAGDTFNAGILTSLNEQNLLTKANIRNVAEQQLEKALSFANAVAAATCERAGANPPWRHELRI